MIPNSRNYHALATGDVGLIYLNAPGFNQGMFFKIFERKYDKDLSSTMGFTWSLVSQKKNLSPGPAFFYNKVIFFNLFRIKI